MDALTYKDMFVSLDLLSNNMSGQQCKLPSHIQAAGWPKMRPAHASLCLCALFMLARILNSVVHIVIIIASCLAARQ